MSQVTSAWLPAAVHTFLSTSENTTNQTRYSSCDIFVIVLHFFFFFKPTTLTLDVLLVACTQLTHGTDVLIQLKVMCHRLCLICVGVTGLLARDLNSLI